MELAAISSMRLLVVNRDKIDLTLRGFLDAITSRCSDPSGATEPISQLHVNVEVPDRLRFLTPVEIDFAWPPRRTSFG
jgi:hypothetical protein